MPLKNNKPIIFSAEISWLADKSGVVSLYSGKKTLYSLYSARVWRA
jgi:hypothetical protein